MSMRTVFLSRMLGVYCTLMGLFMAAHPIRAWDTISAFSHNQPLVFIVAIFVILGGLAMVLAHNVWSGGAAPVIVTLMGWATLAKGVVLLFTPPEMIADFYGRTIHNDGLIYFEAAIALLLGVYLTYVGFKPSAGRGA